jgi:hypothetical protein
MIIDPNILNMKDIIISLYFSLILNFIINMGASASVNTIVTNITNRVETKLIQRAEASAIATCRVDIGSISIRNNRGCVVEVKNLCSALAVAQVDAVVDASIEFYNSLTTEQKQEAPRWFTVGWGLNTTVNNIENDFRQHIEQTCKSEAILDSTITIQDITIENCTAPPSEGIVRFTFTNAGTAAGQCAIGLLLDLQVGGANDVSSRQTQGFDLGAIVPYIVAGIVLVTVVYLVIKLMGTKLTPKQQIDLELAKRGAVSSKLIQLSQFITKTEYT